MVPPVWPSLQAHRRPATAASETTKIHHVSCGDYRLRHDRQNRSSSDKRSNRPQAKSSFAREKLDGDPGQTAVQP